MALSASQGRALTLGDKVYSNGASGATAGAQAPEQPDIAGFPAAKPITAAEAARRRLPGWHPSMPASIVYETPAHRSIRRSAATGHKLITALSGLFKARRFRPATLAVLAVLLWRYRAGQVYRGLNSELGHAAGLTADDKPYGERTTYRAIAELCAHGFVVRVEGGLVLRLIEERLPADQRVHWRAPPAQVDCHFPLMPEMADWRDNKDNEAAPTAKLDVDTWTPPATETAGMSAAHYAACMAALRQWMPTMRYPSESNARKGWRKIKANPDYAAATQSGAKACRQCGTTRWRTLTGADLCEQCET